MTLDGLRNLMLDDLGRHLERLAQQKRDDVLAQVVALVVGRGVEQTSDAYLAAAERAEAGTRDVRAGHQAGLPEGPLTPSGAMERNKAVVRRFVEEMLNRGDLDSLERFAWEDVVEQVPFPGQGPGIDGLRDVLRRMRTGFPDARWTVKEQIAEGDKVLTRFEWAGTHRGEFLGVPATGRPVRVWGMVIDRLAAGRIKETRILMDTLGLMAQLGVFPPPSSGTDA